MKAHSTVDVVVIGGGPAGCTAATVLADLGHDVVLLEKAPQPSYKVGESLIPYCYFPLDRIGVVDQLKAAQFVEKRSVQFVGVDGKVSQPFFFADHFDHDASRTWQVTRIDFDGILINNAIEHGVTVELGTTVVELIVDDDFFVGVEAVDRNGDRHCYRAPITIDASGRNGIAASRNRWRVGDPNLRKVAIWSYFRGTRNEAGVDPGVTTVAHVPHKGWFWHIPLKDQVSSVGVVAESDHLFAESRESGVVFAEQIEKNCWIRDCLEGAERVDDFRVTSDYSYRSRHCASNGLLLAGDAFSFIDPIFSSGVFLALYSGERAADAAHAALEAEDFGARSFESYGVKFCAAVEIMRRLVYAFYDPAFSFSALMKKYPELRSDLTDCLIGNVERGYTELFDAIGEFASLPETIEYSSPLP